MLGVSLDHLSALKNNRTSNRVDLSLPSQQLVLVTGITLSNDNVHLLPLSTGWDVRTLDNYTCVMWDSVSSTLTQGDRGVENQQLL